MQIIRNDGVFADALAQLLQAHRPNAFSIATVDGKQERGYGPVIIGSDFLQCQSSPDEKQNERIYPLSSIVSVMPSG